MERERTSDNETGFDSGSTLDYVYQNQAHGRTALGRLVDRSYLDAVGWRGIRRCFLGRDKRG